MDNKITTFGCIVLLTIVAIPFWIVWGPIYLILRTIVTILQPYLYKRQSIEWNKSYQENLKHGIYIY